MMFLGLDIGGWTLVVAVLTLAAAVHFGRATLKEMRHISKGDRAHAEGLAADAEDRRNVQAQAEIDQRLEAFADLADRVAEGLEQQLRDQPEVGDASRSELDRAQTNHSGIIHSLNETHLHPQFDARDRIAIGDLRAVISSIAPSSLQSAYSPVAWRTRAATMVKSARNKAADVRARKRISSS